MYFSLIQIIRKMPGRRRNRAGRRQEPDLWFVASHRHGTRPDCYMEAWWGLTAARVANYVEREIGVAVDIVVEEGGRPVVVAGNTMVCQPIPGRRTPTNHRPCNPYTYVVRRG